MIAEFLLALGFASLALLASAGLLRCEWNRTRCAYLTFEAAHARLIGSRIDLDSHVEVSESSSGVHASGRCGEAKESVELPWLDGPPDWTGI